MTTSTTWRTDSPPASGWFTSDRDPDLLRYFHADEPGRSWWSAPVHADDLDRIGERVRLVPAESPAGIEWRD